MSFPVPGFLQQNAPDRSTRTTRRVIFYAPQNRMPSAAESRIIPMGDGALPFFRRQRACSPHSSRNTTMERRSGAMSALSAANPASAERTILRAFFWRKTQLKAALSSFFARKTVLYYTSIGVCMMRRCAFPRWRIPGKVHGKGCLLKK